MQNYFNFNKVMKFENLPNSFLVLFIQTKQFFSFVYTKSFVNYMPNMNVIQRRNRIHLMHSDEIFLVQKHKKM